MFLNARLYMYTNVYYHRTTRAIDEHLKELFKDTMAALFPFNPVENLKAYRELTDWSLLEAVRKWGDDGDESTAALGQERPSSTPGNWWDGSRGIFRRSSKICSSGWTWPARTRGRSTRL
jgi:HD superfamily phosphohydrolase